MKATVETRFESPFGQLDLHRHGHPNEQLRAWDAADTYLLESLRETSLHDDGGETLIVNDGFGALSLALFGSNPISLIDSAHGQRALRENCRLNPSHSFTPRVITTSTIPDDLAKPIARIVMKLPKSHAQLAVQLSAIRRIISPNTQVLMAAMAKRIKASTIKVIEMNIGTAKCSLARKKARLIHASPDPSVSPPPRHWKRYQLAEANSGLDIPISIRSVGGTFSHGKLDLGTKLLLASLPNDLGPAVIDHGCGTGILGIVAALKCNPRRITFVDDADAAISSTKANINEHMRDRPVDVQVLHQDSLSSISPASQDDVLNNPPFHDAAARTPYLALSMFQDAHRVLRPGGRLWVVGNRHLAYHSKLRAIFGNCIQVGAHQKFVVLCATKT